MHRSPNPTRTILAASLLCAGCVSYEPEPLDAPALVRALSAEMDAAAEPIDLATAVAHMLEHNRAIRVARAQAEQAEAVAAVGTPLPNPTFSIGPLFLAGQGITDATRYGLESAVGFTLPLFSGRISAAEDLQKQQARLARWRAIAVARGEYLGLRQDLLLAAGAADRSRQQERVAEVLQGAIDNQKRLGARADFSALDLTLAAVELEAVAATAAASRAQLLDATGRLARRVGSSPVMFGDWADKRRPPLPEAIPTKQVLRELATAHPDLATLRAQYDVAESTLRLAVRRQYPDLGIGASYELEQKTDRYGLPLSLTLPLFDRNQVGIARATAARVRARQEFEAAVRQQWIEVEVAWGLLELQRGRYARLEQRLAARSERIAELIRASVSAGTLDAAGRLQALRRLAEARIAMVAAKADLYAAWARLERACGAPLLAFPGAPEPPAGPEEAKK